MTNDFLKHYKGIIDTTLREGQQFRLSHFSLAEQKKILKMLTTIGVERIEVGNPAVETVKKDIMALTKITKRPKILSHIRNTFVDIQAAIASNVDGINILCTIYPQRLTKMNMTFHAYLQQLEQGINFAKKHKKEVGVSVEHFFQSPVNQAIQVYQTAESLGADRIGVADTLGAAMSWDVEAAIKVLRHIFHIDIEVHFHNDLGLANSNALTAIKSGANWVNTSLLGIGERSGITPLSVFLASLYTFDTVTAKRYQLQYLTPAENALAKMLGCSVPFNLLTNKVNGFSHKAGIHLDSIITFGPHTYELFSPEIIGNTRTLLYGTAISGRTTKNDIERFNVKYKST